MKYTLKSNAFHGAVTVEWAHSDSVETLAHLAILLHADKVSRDVFMTDNGVDRIIWHNGRWTGEV